VAGRSTTTRRVGVVRYNSNGSIDTTFNPGISFGSGGSVVTGFGGSLPNGAGLALAIQSNGEIVVAGEAGTSTLGGFQLNTTSFTLTSYTGTGQLDTSFGNNGVVLTPIGQNNISFASAVAIQSKIVAAGSSGGASRDNFIDTSKLRVIWRSEWIIEIDIAEDRSIMRRPGELRTPSRLVKTHQGRSSLVMLLNSNLEQLWPQLSGHEQAVSRRIIGDAIKNGVRVREAALIDQSA
jgi:hypothetical protein